MNLNFRKSLLSIALVSQLGLAQTSNVNLTWRYQDADSLNKQQGKASVEFASDQNFISDKKLEKTLFVLKVGQTFQESLERFQKACRPTIEEPPVRPLTRSFPPTLPPIMPPRPPAEVCEERIATAEALLKDIDGLSKTLRDHEALRGDVKLQEVLDLGRKLAKNMKEAKAIHYWGHGLELAGGPKVRATAAMGGLNLTAGGAQDFGYFRKVVEDGQVPRSGSLTDEGFMSEFDLSLSEKACDELVCVHPAVKVNADKSKLFVQIAMNSNVTEANFKRKPLNLAIVLDISGSMQANDNTEKSRLEWAKEALIQTVNELNEQDMLSIVLFESSSEVLIPAAPVTDKAAIIAKVNALKTKGSTNLEAGLQDGYEQVLENAFDLDGYENRVILISDAGLNTGVTDEASVLKTITNHAQEDIGLTAIGLGLNFNQDFIHGITQSHGGNYVFVHSGKDMYRYFESFDFLVTPVAYNFKVNLDIEGVEAKLVNAYGVPKSEGEAARKLIDIQTLFFSKAGGAILLEYQLK